MKKSLLALAVIGAFAGAANAQSSVTLYGLVDTYVESYKAGTISNTRLSAGGLSGPRWGMRGSEDLGGGNSANFTLEGGYNRDNGLLGQGGGLFGRQGFVGLGGGWGSLTLGRQYAPIFYTQADSDTDGYSSFSQPAHLSNINGNTLRQDNQIRYTTATLGTFKGMVSYNPGENPSTAPGGSTVGRMFGANFTVGAGPVNIVGGYHRENATSATTGSSSSNGINNHTLLSRWAYGIASNFSSVIQKGRRLAPFFVPRAPATRRNASLQGLVFNPSARATHCTLPTQHEIAPNRRRQLRFEPAFTAPKARDLFWTTPESSGEPT